MAETTSGGPRSGREVHAAGALGPERRELPVGAIVFAGALIALLSMGVRSVLPLWQTPMLQDLGWTSFEFSVALATQNLLWGAFSPLFGALADRFGAWSSLLVGAMLQAAGLWVMSAAADPTAFFLSAGLMIGVAQSASGMGIVLGAVGRVVPERHRTMAFGLITSASSAGMIVVTPIGRALLETQGWADAFVGLAILSLPMIALAFLMRTRRG
ncbi:MAG: MFS transporter, partial [Alphaproteobacteria bacterium]